MFVEDLRIYPIKSCAGVSVQEALITTYGLAYPADPRIYDRSEVFIGFLLFIEMMNFKDDG